MGTAKGKKQHEVALRKMLTLNRTRDVEMSLGKMLLLLLHKDTIEVLYFLISEMKIIVILFHAEKYF